MTNELCKHRPLDPRTVRDSLLLRPLGSMCLVLMGLTLCACSLDASNAEGIGSAPDAIVGGVEAPIGAWPSAVSVFWFDSPEPPWWCGGTLIGPRWVLTAAHCVADDLNPANYEVRIGRHDLTSSAGQVLQVASIIMHPSFTHLNDDAPGGDNDLALVELTTAVTNPMSRLASPARMGEIYPGDDITLLGWGDVSQGGNSSNRLRMVTVDVIGTGAACSAVSGYSNVTENEICLGNLAAGGQDTCQGDSGGPALIQRDGEWFVLGVTSWGFGCAQPNLPGVYTFLPNYHGWVESATPGAPVPSLMSSAQIMTIL